MNENQIKSHIAKSFKDWWGYELCPINECDCDPTKITDKEFYEISKGRHYNCPHQKLFYIAKMQLFVDPYYLMKIYANMLEEYKELVDNYISLKDDYNNRLCSGHSNLKKPTKPLDDVFSWDTNNKEGG